MAVDKEVRDKALILFLEGKTEEEISNLVGVANSTVTDWKDKFGWRELKEKTEKRAMETISKKYGNIQQKIMSDQITIGDMTGTELIKRLKNQEKVNAEIKLLQEEWHKYVDKLRIEENKQPTPLEKFAYREAITSLRKQLMDTKDLIVIEKYIAEMLIPKTTINKNLNLNVEANKEDLNKQIFEIVGKIRDGEGN